MRLSAEDRQAVAAFREGFERGYRDDPRFRAVRRLDREDESTLTTHFQVADNLWLEMTVRPFLPQVRAGILTDDRWKNEDLEDKIEESGDTMSEFVEMGFEEAGLEWLDPPVEHYREQGKYFCFVTAFEIPSLAALAAQETITRLQQVFDGYYEAFKPAILKSPAKS